MDCTTYRSLVRLFASRPCGCAHLSLVIRRPARILYPVTMRARCVISKPAPLAREHAPVVRGAYNSLIHRGFAGSSVPSALKGGSRSELVLVPLHGVECPNCSASAGCPHA